MLLDRDRRHRIVQKQKQNLIYLKYIIPCIHTRLIIRFGSPAITLQIPSCYTLSTACFKPMRLMKTFWSCSCFFVNKLVPCAWLLSFALEVWSLRFQVSVSLRRV